MFVYKSSIQPSLSPEMDPIGRDLHFRLFWPAVKCFLFLVFFLAISLFVFMYKRKFSLAMLTMVCPDPVLWGWTNTSVDQSVSYVLTVKVQETQEVLILKLYNRIPRSQLNRREVTLSGTLFSPVTCSFVHPAQVATPALVLKVSAVSWEIWRTYREY